MATLDDRFDYIQASIQYLFWETYYWVVSCCKKAGPQREQVMDREPDIAIDPHGLYLESCRDGTLDFVKGLMKKHDDLDKNKGLLIASEQGHDNVVSFLIDQGATNLDNALKVACKANRLSTAELLVQKGARTVVGIRVSTSMNITRMLYRYENQQENITY